MASSDSAKKVARVAARSGGGSGSKKQANWLFPLALVVIVALGATAVAFARSQNAGGRDNSVAPRARLSETAPYDHWHAALAINVCGEELPPLTDAEQDLTGIHSHGDGLAHIHPFTTRVSGERATIRRYFDTTGVTIDGEKVVLPVGLHDDQAFESGTSTCGGEEAAWVLAKWNDSSTAASNPPDEIITEDFGSVRFDTDLAAYTLAFVPVGTTDIPAPSVSGQTSALGQQDDITFPEDMQPEGEPIEGGEVPIEIDPEAGVTDVEADPAGEG